MKQHGAPEYHFFPSDSAKVIKQLGKDALLKHSKECSSSAISKFGRRAPISMVKSADSFIPTWDKRRSRPQPSTSWAQDQWWSTSYRCHALALLLGATPNELMAELYGKATGNALGRGGSMHFYHRPDSGRIWHRRRASPYWNRRCLYYQISKKKDEVSVCFMGDGAVAQGAFTNRSIWQLFGIFLASM